MLVLLVEDNIDLATNIIEYLEYQGLECDWADRGNQGLELATRQSFDVIVLDLTLPGMDGIDICKNLRSRQINTPILMLTARSLLENKLEGFDAGADDYLVKPFDLPELHARINILANRRRPLSSVLQLDDLMVDCGARRVIRDGIELALNRTQWTLLIKLMQNSPNVVSRDELEQAVWGDDRPESDALKIHLHNLRTIIDKPFHKHLIHTVRGVGVAMRDDLF